jgi:hypothetical protein
MHNNLRLHGHRIRVEEKLTKEQQEQRRALQQLRRTLVADGAKVRWRGLSLQQWRLGLGLPKTGL